MSKIRKFEKCVRQYGRPGRSLKSKREHTERVKDPHPNREGPEKDESIKNNPEKTKNTDLRHLTE